MREKGQTEAAETLETPVFSRGIEILTEKAVFVNDMEAKEMCMNNPIVKGQYDKADNPIFEVFYLDDAKAVIADFSGNPPKEYTL